MFKKTDSLRKTLNISSWLSRLSRACSPIIREEADGWVGTQETGSVCEFWILKLVGPGVPITALFTCVPVDIPVMTEPGEVAVIFWRDSDQLAGLEVSAHLFPGGPSSAPPLPFPLLSHFVVIWRTLGVGLLEPRQGASSLSILKRFSSWELEDQNFLCWEGSSLGSFHTCHLPLTVGSGAPPLPFRYVTSWTQIISLNTTLKQLLS